MLLDSLLFGFFIFITNVCFFQNDLPSILFIKPNCTLNPIFFNPLYLLSLPPPTNTISYKQMIWTLWILHSYHLSQFLSKFHQRTNYFVLKNLYYLKTTTHPFPPSPKTPFHPKYLYGLFTFFILIS